MHLNGLRNHAHMVILMEMSVSKLSSSSSSFSSFHFIALFFPKLPDITLSKKRLHSKANQILIKIEADLLA